MALSRRQFAAGTLGLSAAAMLSGCARGTAGSLQFWAMGNEAAAVPELLKQRPMMPGFPAVDLQPLPWSAAHEKLLTGFAGGSLPDVGQIGNSWLAELASIGAIAPVPAEHEGLFTDQFAGVVETNRIGGRLWSVPWYVDTRLHFFRRDLFARAGYDAPPLRWADWKGALHKVKAVAGEGNFAVLMPINEFEHLLTIALSAGAALLGDNGTRGAFSQPEFIEALSFYKSLFDEKLAPLASATQISNVWNEFQKGFFSVYPSGPWTIGDMKTRLPASFQSHWGTSVNPGPDGPGHAAPGGSSLVVYANARDPAAAWKLVAHLLDPGTQEIFQKLTGDLPSRRSAWSAAGLENDPVVRPFGQQLERSRALPKVPEWERIVNEMQVVAERCVRGQYSVKEAAAEIDRRADRLLEKRRWMMAKGRAL